MTKIVTVLIVVVSLMFVNRVSANDYEATPQWIGNLPAAQSNNQLVVVAVVGDTTAWISMHERDAFGDWFQIMTTPGFIGKNGLGKTREGDSKTPVGVFRFNKAFGIAPDPNCQLPYTQVDNHIYWSGDANCKYNEMVDIREYPQLDKNLSEHLIDCYPNYAYCLNINYNEAGVVGKGSAIFLHCFGKAKPWTGGCIAIPSDKMLTVMRNVKPDCAVVIDTLENLNGTI